MQEAVFSPDGRRAASVDAAPHGVSFFDVDRRTFVGHAAPPVDRPYASTPVFAPNGDVLVTVMASMLAESRATARYDSRTGALESTWTGELRGVVTLDGALRAVILDPRAGQVELHALTTPEAPVIQIATPKEVRDVVVAQGLVVVSTLESIRAFDLRGREVWARAEGDATLNVAPEASAIVRERGDGVHVLDLATGKERRAVPGAKPVPEDGRPSFGNTAPEAAPFVVAKLAGKLALVDIGPAPRAPIVIGDEAQPIAIAPGARFAVTAAATGAVSLVDVARRSIEGIGSVTGRVERLSQSLLTASDGSPSPRSGPPARRRTCCEAAAKPSRSTGAARSRSARASRPARAARGSISRPPRRLPGGRRSARPRSPSTTAARRASRRAARRSATRRRSGQAVARAATRPRRARPAGDAEVAVGPAIDARGVDVGSVTASLPPGWRRDADGQRRDPRGVAERRAARGRGRAIARLRALPRRRRARASPRST